MRVKLFTLRYSSTLGGFDDAPLREPDILTLQRELCDRTCHPRKAFTFRIHDP